MSRRWLATMLRAAVCRRLNRSHRLRWPVTRFGQGHHDFQSLLRGGARWLGGESLAKSAEIPRNRVAYERARTASGYPKGGRHELLSVRLAESASMLLPERDDLRDLVLHLIASHHGHCRPFRASDIRRAGCGM